MPKRPQRRAAIGNGFGQVRAVARYYAMRETPKILSALGEGRLMGVYSGVNRRGGAETVGDLDYLFMPAAQLAPVAGRLADSLVARDGMPGADARSQYVEVAGGDGMHRLRAAAPAAPMVGRLTTGEVDRLLAGPLLRWQLGGREWQLMACPAVEFEHGPLVLVCGRPAGQAVYAAAAVTPWEAQLVELLTVMRADE